MTPPADSPETQCKTCGGTGLGPNYNACPDCRDKRREDALNRAAEMVRDAHDLYDPDSYETTYHQVAGRLMSAGVIFPADAATQTEWMLGQVLEMGELGAMTAEQLVDAALKATEDLPMGGRLYNVIEQMMDRIDPTWDTRHAPKETL